MRKWAARVQLQNRFIVADVDTVSLVEDSIGATVNSEGATSRRSPCRGTFSKGFTRNVGQEGKPWQLYDIEADRTELHDLAGRFPQRVKEMDALYQTWYERAVVPYD